MDINSMKVTDLKKELKSRGLSIVGNKSELMARLESALNQSSQSSQAINDNEDSVLNEEEDEILGSDLLDGGSEGDPKADDALIDDLLGNENNNLLTTNKPKSQTITTIKRSTAASAMSSVTDNNTKDKSIENSNNNNNNNSINTNNEQLSQEKSPTTNLLKTTNAIKLTAGQRKELRAQKFGDNKLSIRAQRFGLDSKTDSNQAKVVSNIDSTSLSEKLKKRAERFGGIVSDKLKKIDDREKLLKRKERFGAITVANTTGNTSSTTSTNANSKRAITFSTKDDLNERKRKRLERFGDVS